MRNPLIFIPILEWEKRGMAFCMTSSCFNSSTHRHRSFYACCLSSLFIDWFWLMQDTEFGLRFNYRFVGLHRFIDRENELRQSKPPTPQPPQRAPVDPWTRSKLCRQYAPPKEDKSSENENWFFLFPYWEFICHTLFMWNRDSISWICNEILQICNRQPLLDV